MNASRRVLFGLSILLTQSDCRRPIESVDCTQERPTTPGDHGCQVPEFADRDFILHIPSGYSGQAMPLVIAMHGAGGNKEGMNPITCPDGNLDSPNCLSKVSDREGFLLVYPDGTSMGNVLNGRSWSQGGGGSRSLRCENACQQGVDDVAYFSALLDTVARVLPYDPKRVYVTGFSNGAGMSHRLACELPNRIAAIAPVGGANQFAGAAACVASRPIPILHIHGDEDRCWPYAGGLGSCVDSQQTSGDYVSVAESTVGIAGYPGWITRYGCLMTPNVESLADTMSDGTTTSKSTYSGCRGGVSVMLYTVAGAGHTWPGGNQYLSESRIGKTSRDFSASTAIWDFFKPLTIP